MNSVEELRLVSTLVRPALAAKDYIPAWQHICFNKGFATAYNDIAAISVETDIGGLQGCVPGELLVKALDSFGASELSLTQSQGILTLTSGRSEMKLPTMTVRDFPFSICPQGKGDFIPITTELIKGIVRCLAYASGDSKSPDQMGVTLDSVGGLAVLYATDNATISRFRTTEPVKLPNDNAIILPAFFCQQLVTLYKAFPKAEADLFIRGGSLQVEWYVEKSLIAALFTKTLADLVPLAFERKIKHCLVDQRSGANALPEGFVSALQRVQLIQSQTVLISGDAKAEVLNMTADSQSGQVHESMPFFGNANRCTVDPALLIRAAKTCTQIEFLDDAVLMTDKDESFIHLISHLG